MTEAFSNPRVGKGERSPFWIWLVLWCGILHVGHLLLAAWAGKPEHALGILGGFALTTILLLATIWLGRFVPRAVTVTGYLIYAITVLYNFLASFQWYFFGSPLTYSRLVDGAHLVFQEKTSEVTAGWDAFFYVDLALSLIALVGPWITYRSRASSRWKIPAVAMLAIGGALFLLNPAARGSNLWGFLVSTPISRPRTVASVLHHEPLRRLLGEQRDSLEPLFEIPDDRVRPNVLIVEYESIGGMYYAFHNPEYGLPTPHYESLMQHGIVGKRHYSVNGGSSHNNDWALMTSLYPPNFGETPFHRDPWIMQKSYFSYFKELDYVTGTFYTGSPNHRDHFKLFRQPDSDVYINKYSPEWQDPRLAAIGSDEERAMLLLFEEIDRQQGQPFLFWYRTYNGHHPYEAPGVTKEMPKRERYHLAVKESDRLLGELVQGLRQRGLFDDTILVVFGDHGEAFGQHEDLRTHSGGVYEELTRSPFVISYPAAIRQPILVDELTSHLDILPTLLDIVGADPAEIAELEGYSLARPIPRDRTLFVANGDDGTVTGVIQGQYKLIRRQSGRGSMLFDVIADPLERENSLGRYPNVVERLTLLERRWVEHRRQGPGRSRLIDPDARQPSAIRIGGNVDVDVFLNGEPIATLSDAKKAVIPVRFRRGHNFVTVAGIPRYRGTQTGLHVELEHGGARIGTGHWWRVSNSTTFIRGRQWLEPATSAEAWDVPEIEERDAKYYISHRRNFWIDLDYGKPFVARVDFEVAGGRLVSDQLEIQAMERFSLVINDQVYGTGRDPEHVYEFAFPRLSANPQVVLKATSGRDVFGFLVNGSVRGREIHSDPTDWECLDNWDPLDLGAYAAAPVWQPAAAVEQLSVTGNWLDGSRWLWSRKPSEHVLCRVASP